MNIRLDMPQGRSSLQRYTCSLKERREWSDSVSCKEPTSKLYVHSLTDSLRTSTTVEASRLGDDCHLHSSKVAPQLHSPTLMRLRSGSSADSRDTGRRGKATKLHSNIEAKQRELTSKHQSAKSGPGVGGGITMWPGMDDMRLSQTETLQLTAAALCLIVGSMCLFMYLHGAPNHTHTPNRPPHQTPHTGHTSSPDTPHTRHLPHQTPPHQTPPTPDTSHTRHTSTPDTSHTRHLPHQTPPTPDTPPHQTHLHTRHLPHQTHTPHTHTHTRYAPAQDTHKTRVCAQCSLTTQEIGIHINNTI